MKFFGILSAFLIFSFASAKEVKTEEQVQNATRSCLRETDQGKSGPEVKYIFKRCGIPTYNAEYEYLESKLGENFKPWISCQEEECSDLGNKYDLFGYGEMNFIKCSLYYSFHLSQALNAEKDQNELPSDLEKELAPLPEDRRDKLENMIKWMKSDRKSPSPCGAPVATS